MISCKTCCSENVKSYRQVHLGKWDSTSIGDFQFHYHTALSFGAVQLLRTSSSTFDVSLFRCLVYIDWFGYPEAFGECLLYYIPVSPILRTTYSNSGPVRRTLQTTIAKMSAEMRDNLLSYEISLRDKTRKMLAVASSDTTDPSPGTSIVESAPILTVSASPQATEPRTLSRSSQWRDQNEALIRTDKDDSFTNTTLAPEEISHKVRRRRSIGLGEAARAASAAASRAIQMSSFTPPTPGSAVSPKGFPSTPFSEHEPRRGSPIPARLAQRPAWMRTRSGGV